MNTIKKFIKFLPLVGMIAFTACSNTNIAQDSTPSSAATNTASNETATKFSAAKGCKNIGVLLPESDSSARYEAYDRPLLDQAIKKAVPGATIQYSNANNDADSQQNQAEAALTKGACILVVDPKDSEKAAVIVQRAKASQVPVIAYDRLIQDPDTAYYVSFDNVRVGELQGQYIADQFRKGAYGLKKGANLVMINGSQTDNNALQFREGAMKALKPLIDNKDITLIFDQYTPNWDNGRAQSLMEGVLTKEKNNVQIAYVANDGMANTVVAALRTQKLDGKVLVTGQDATLSGIQNILVGAQSMTIYKPIAKEAQATAQLVAALSNGTDPGEWVNGQTQTKASGQIASVLVTPIAVDKTNVQQTVISDSYLTKDQVCNGLTGDTTRICKG
jgi:D-xylose transport system substrate-binding protein